MKYLIHMLTFSDGLLSNCKNQLIFDDILDVKNFIAHYSSYCEYLYVYPEKGKIYGMTSFNFNKPIFHIENN